MAQSVQSPFSSRELEELRKDYPHTARQRMYFNHAAIGPLSVKVVDAIQKRLKQRSSGNIDYFDRDAAVAEMARKYMAKLINAPSEDRIAFVSNTSEGLNLVASGLEWESGDHVIINDLEFPANVYPYLNLRQQGVEVEKVKHQGGRVTPQLIEASIGPSTRLVAISAVQFLNGYRADLKAIGRLCKRHDCLFIVDAIQALGVVPLDVEAFHIDALVSGGHKWMLGPQGIGILYLSEALQEQIVHQYVGWLSVEEPWLLFETDQALDATARRYELGTPNFSGIHGLNASLENIFQIGPRRITQQVRMLTTRLIETFREWDSVSLSTPESWEERGGIVTISLPDHVNNQSFINTLEEESVTVALRENSLRIAPHYYNTMQEIERLLDIINNTLEIHS